MKTPKDHKDMFKLENGKIICRAQFSHELEHLKHKP